jgi:undecaprenyl diphosphate synthase
VVRAAREVGVRALTLYAFSSQNWNRPPEEVGALMQLLRDYVVEERPEIMDNAIRLIAIGDVEKLPDFVREPLESLMRDSGSKPGHDPLPGALLRGPRGDRLHGRGARRARPRAARSSPRTSPRTTSRPRSRRAASPSSI